MNDFAYYIYETIGFSNIFGFLALAIGVFFSFYYYYKGLFRLIYSTGVTCTNCNSISEWNDEMNNFNTRILIYNNGGKTINKSDVKHFSIFADGEIYNVRFLNVIKNVKIIRGKHRTNLLIDEFDPTEYLVLEVNSKGKIFIKGRVLETGNIIQTEPKIWVYITLIYILLFFVNVFYLLLFKFDDKTITGYEILINMLPFIIFTIFLRFIHSLLFIPDSLTSKYLDTLNNSGKKFKNQF